MYAPPPPPSLSTAEIEARRKRMHVNDGRDAVQDMRSLSRNADASAASSRRRRFSDETHGTGIMRRIASFGVGRDKTKVPVRVLDISAPLTSAPPLTSLPSIPQIYPIMTPVSAPPARPLPQPDGRRPSRGEDRRPRVTSSSSVLSDPSTSSHDGSSRIPRRPPRPTDGLVLESQLPGFDAFVRSAAPVSAPIARTASNASKLSSSSTSVHALDSDNNNASRFVRKFKLVRPPARLKEESLRTITAKGMESAKSASDGGSNASPCEHAASDAIPAPDKALPDTPSSILKTPADLYDNRRDLKRTSIKSERLSMKAAKRNTYRPRDSGVGVEEISPLDLSIGQNFKRKAMTSFSPGPQGASTICTQIHLRGGSIVTVTSPEVDIRKNPTYLHGPIRLLRPSAFLRRDSVASLDPFQSAVDKVFKDGESISRRRSELAMAEDICEYFLDLALGDWHYDGDMLASEGMMESSESDEEADFADSWQRFEIPPDSPTVWRAPPVQDEESLRVKGIKWLSRQRRRAHANDGQQGSLPTMPRPGESMLGAVLAPSMRSHARQVDGEVIDKSQTDGRVAAPWIRSAMADDKLSLATAPRRRSQ